MPTPQQQLPFYYGSFYGDIAYPDVYLDMFLIVNDQVMADKWYLLTHDTKTNTATWTKIAMKAKSFDSKKEAYDFGQSLKRPFYVEDYSPWVF
jgi:hypothetical protein